MKIASRLLLGTFAAAAMTAAAPVSAHADESSSTLDPVLSPVACSGFIGTVLNELNPESSARSCGLSHPNTSARS